MSSGFFGTINGVSLASQITPLGGGNYSFGIVGSGAPNLPSANPVKVGLTIGNNTGNDAVNATFR